MFHPRSIHVIFLARISHLPPTPPHATARRSVSFNAALSFHPSFSKAHVLLS